MVERRKKFRGEGTLTVIVRQKGKNSIGKEWGGGDRKRIQEWRERLLHAVGGGERPVQICCGGGGGKRDEEGAKEQGRPLKSPKKGTKVWPASRSRNRHYIAGGEGKKFRSRREGACGKVCKKRPVNGGAEKRGGRSTLSRGEMRRRGDQGKRRRTGRKFCLLKGKRHQELGKGLSPYLNKGRS